MWTHTRPSNTLPFTRLVWSTPPYIHLLSWSFWTSSCPNLSLVRPLPPVYTPILTMSLPDYVVDCVVDTVDYAMNRPSTSVGRRSASHKTETAAFTTFVTNVLTRAEVTIPVVLASLVYVDRAKPHLHIALEEWACERVFLGAVMLASKVTTIVVPSCLAILTFFSLLVSQRLDSQERPLGTLHGRLWQT